MDRVLKQIGGFVLGIGAFVVAINVFGAGYDLVQGKDDSQIKGLVVEKSVYTTTCVKEATKGENALTNEQAVNYCECTYDVGVQRYGAEEFTRMNLELEDTQQLTPELNRIVNECVARVI